jgi:hypothetical protein
MADWPEEIREPLIDCHVSPEWFGVGFAEAKNLAQPNDELRCTGKMPDVPLIILTWMGIDPFKEAVSGELAAGLEGEHHGGVVQCYLVRAGGIAVWCDPVEVGLVQPGETAP